MTATRPLSLNETRELILLHPATGPLSRDALHAALDDAIASWLRITVDWSAGCEPGEFRFVGFWTQVAPDVRLYVQFWSEPPWPLDCEVSSGHTHPPTAAWLGPDRRQRIESLGFATGGDAGNFRRETPVTDPAELTRLARMVVDIFWSGFDYRGLTALSAIAGRDRAG